MANKGVNTLVLEAKENLINAINGCIKTGIPVDMVSIIVESLLSDLNNNVKVTIQDMNGINNGDSWEPNEYNRNT